MKPYLLIVKTYNHMEEDGYEEELIEMFSSFDRAKEFGLEFLKKNLGYYCKDTNKSIKQYLEDEQIDFDFRIIEEDIEYAEKFDKELDFLDEIEKLLIYEPTHKEYVLDYTGEITNIVISYLANQKEKFGHSLYMKPNDLLENAGRKFQVGDLVKIVKPNMRLEDLSFEHFPTYSDIYVVRYLPRRIEGQKYLRNTYALAEIKDEDYAPGIYTKEFHEEQIALYDGEIEEDSPIDVLRKIIKKEMKVDRETWDKLKNGVISLREKDKDNNNYYKKVLNLK